MIQSQSLKCNGTQGNAVSPPPIYNSKRSPTSDCYNARERHTTIVWGPNLNVAFPHLYNCTLTTVQSATDGQRKPAPRRRSLRQVLAVGWSCNAHRRCSDIDSLWVVRPRSQQGIGMLSPRRPDERPTAAPGGVLETVDRHHVEREAHQGTPRPTRLPGVNCRQNWATLMRFSSIFISAQQTKHAITT